MSRINKLSAIAVKSLSWLTNSSIRKQHTMYVMADNRILREKGGIMLNSWMVKMTISLIAGICFAITAQAKVNTTTPDSIPFAPAVNITTGYHPIPIHGADLDNDNDIDLVVGNTWADTVSILKNNGNNTFQNPENYYVYEPYSIFCANLDTDSSIDLVIASHWGHRVTILKNAGGGIFGDSTHYGVGNNPTTVFCADLDRDNDLDFATSNYLSYNVSVWKNNGDGTFDSLVFYPTGGYPSSVVFADIDGDSALDLVVTKNVTNDVSIWKNNGSGTFSLYDSYPTGAFPYSVVCADLDSDGDSDMAVTNRDDNNVSIFKNNGDGTFVSPPVDYAVGNGPHGLSCADLDNDGYLDIVVANHWSYNVTILKNNGNGTFSNAVNYGAGNGPTTVFCADLDYDNDLDLAITNSEGNNISILINLTSEQHVDSLLVSSDTVCLDARLHKVPLVVKNLDTLKAMTIPLHPEITCPGFVIDSVSFVGTRIENWEEKTVVIGSDSIVLGLVANLGGGTPPLLPGEGTIVYIYYTIDCDTAHTGETCYFSLDTTIIQPENQHLLFVDNHNHEFIPYFERGTTTVNLYRPGDVNCNCEINIGDVVGIINYLFKNGAEPCPMDAGDVNGDCNVDVGDAVYMINYLFKGGPAPVCGCASNPLLTSCCGGGAPSFPKIAGIAQVGLVTSEKSMDIIASLAAEVAGVQLEFNYNPEQIQSIVPELTDRTQGMTLFFSTKDGILKVGILDLTGENLISAGEGALARLNITGSDLSSLEIKKAIMVNENATPFEVNILPKEEKQTYAPKEFELSQNIPNPFNPETQISYSLPEAAKVRLTVYNVLGRKVKKIVDEYQTAGSKTVHWDGKDESGSEVASGIYFYRLDAGRYIETKKMVLMK